MDLSEAPGFLKDFPNDCCGWASKFIGQFLVDEYKLSPQHVYAPSHPNYYGDGHEWIEIDNIIIDITADQFNEYGSTFPKEIVCSVNDSKWHNNWENISKDSAFEGFEKYDKIFYSNEMKCSDLYSLICKKVKQEFVV